MVHAILDGRKTQTRRKAPIRELNILQHPGDMITWSVSFLKAVKGVLSNHSGGKFSDLQARSIIASQFNPYGKPGDLLWVREAWRAWSQYDDWPPSRLPPVVDLQYIADASAPWSSRYRSPRFLPRWASRITLRITDVRVERLQDITEDDARAEGCDPVVHPDGAVDCGTRKTTFAGLWNKINGPGAWDANPWVWVVSFERVKP
jgi:hypothetical protein